MTHFLEHMVFKGTPRRTALDVNRDFDRIGADYNAFTSEENTVFHAAVLPEYLPQAVDILADILRPSLRDEDFDMEKKVIIEEIGMYEDQPMWSAYDHAKRRLLRRPPPGQQHPGHPGQHHGPDARPDARVFPAPLRGARTSPSWPRRATSTGRAFVDLVAGHCGGWERGPVGRECLRETAGSGSFEVMTQGEGDAGARHPDVARARRPTRRCATAADLLGMAVGDDSGSRLYWALVDPGLAESADCSFHEYEGTGAFYTSFSCEPDQAPENLDIVRSVLRDVQKNGITEEELRRPRNKMLSRVVRGSERPKGRMMALGHDLDLPARIPLRR